MSVSTPKIRAAGLLIYRLVPAASAQPKIEYLCLQTSYGQHHWTPPKGHVDPGEDDFTTAKRETEEEAGLSGEQIEIDMNWRRELHYNVPKGAKVVVYWLAKLISGQVKLSDEHKAFEWADLNRACELQTWPEMQQLLNEADKHILDLRPSMSALPNEVLLVVLSHCTPRARLNTLPLVSKRINALCQNPKAWDRVTRLRLGVGQNNRLNQTKILQLAIDSDQDEDTEISDKKFDQVEQVVPLLRKVKTLTLCRGYPELNPALLFNANLWTNLRYLRIVWVSPDHNKQNILQLLKSVLRKHAGQMQHVRLCLDITAARDDYEEPVPLLELAARSGLMVDRLKCSGALIQHDDDDLLDDLPLNNTNLSVNKLTISNRILNTNKLLNALRYGRLSCLDIECHDQNEVSPDELNTFLQAVEPAVFSALRSCFLSVHSDEGEYTTSRLLEATEILLGKAPRLKYLYIKPFFFPSDAPHLEVAPFVHLIRVCMDRAKTQNKGMKVDMENVAHITDLVVDGVSPVIGPIQTAFPAPDYKLILETDEDWELSIEHVPTGRLLHLTCVWTEDVEVADISLYDHLLMS